MLHDRIAVKICLVLQTVIIGVHKSLYIIHCMHANKSEHMHVRHGIMLPQQSAIQPLVYNTEVHWLCEAYEQSQQTMPCWSAHMLADKSYGQLKQHTSKQRSKLEKKR